MTLWIAAVVGVLLAAWGAVYLRNRGRRKRDEGSQDNYPLW